MHTYCARIVRMRAKTDAKLLLILQNVNSNGSFSYHIVTLWVHFAIYKQANVEVDIAT